MNDLNAFDQLVAREVVAGAGPSELVDDLAVYESVVVTTRSPKWRFQSMFSATKFVVAGAIVALFGGLLLAGVLTQPSDDGLPVVGASASATTLAEPTDAATSEPEPTTEVRADDTTTAANLLPGVDLVTEEVEPGLYRIHSDGVRELEAPVSFNLASHNRSTVEVAPDGSTWLFIDGHFFRLGDAATHKGWFGDDVEVDSEGNVWTLLQPGKRTAACRSYGPPHLMLYDGDEWKARSCNVLDFQLDPGGGAWVAMEYVDPKDPQPENHVFGHIEPGEWKESRTDKPRTWGGRNVPGLKGFVMETPIGPADGEGRVKGWLIDGGGGLLEVERRADGSGSMGGPEVQGRAVAVGMGDDGTSWVYLEFDNPLVQDDDLAGTPSYVLRRFSSDEGGQRTGKAFESPLHWLSSQRMVETCCGMVPRLDVAADGAVWLPTDQGLARFDGEDWTWFLEGSNVEDIDIAPDGTVWVQANDLDMSEGADYWEQEGTTSTYVITPEALAAAE